MSLSGSTFAFWVQEMSSRADNIRSLFSATGRGLEIGPSHAPLTAKRDGFDVEILDYMNAEQLRNKYAGAGVDISMIEEVDYVGDGRSLVDTIGDSERFDWIIASHVVEHVPDLIGFLKDCGQLLKTGGVLVLAVPDKRCCFDLLRPVSTVGQALQAHVEGRKRPPPGVIFDDVAYARLRRNTTGWPLKSTEPLAENRSPEDAWSLFESAVKQEIYHDVHCWVFVPSSFRLLTATLAAFGVIELHEKIFSSVDGEFYAVLEKGGPNIKAFDLGNLAIQSALEERQVSLTL